MITARVNVVGGWGQDLARKVNRKVPLEVAESVRLGAETASQLAEARHRTGRMAEMEILPVVGTAEGWAGGFRSKAWYAIFQDKGTRAGITPLRFLEKGRTVARRDLVERLNTILRRV